MQVFSLFGGSVGTWFLIGKGLNYSVEFNEFLNKVAQFMI
jgi:hypothetical protein